MASIEIHWMILIRTTRTIHHYHHPFRIAKICDVMYKPAALQIILYFPLQNIPMTRSQITQIVHSLYAYSNCSLIVLVAELTWHHFKTPAV